MLYRIADLLVDVPMTGGLDIRCSEYLYGGAGEADIIISEELYRPHLYPAVWSEDMIAYMESCSQFYSKLVNFHGFFLHASAVEFEGNAYLFSGPSGVGKSTHTRLWKQSFREEVHIFNDDKPALRFVDSRWYAYGTPWCGKDGINQNKKVSLAGICFLKQAEENHIRRLSKKEAVNKILSQTFRNFKTAEGFECLLSHIDEVVRTIPVFELENRPEPEAVYMSRLAMYKAAKESGL